MTVMITTFLPWVILLGIVACGIVAVIYLKRAVCFLISKQFRLALRAFLVSCAFGVVPALIVSAIISIMSHGQPPRVICHNNLRSFVLMMKMYAGDHHENYPDSFNELAGEYLKAGDLRVFTCRASEHQAGSPTNIHAWTDYAYVSGLTDTDNVDCVLAFCLPENHKDDGANVGLIGGRVEWYSCKYSYTNGFGRYIPTFQDLTNTPALFYGTTDEAKLADLKKRTRIIWPHSTGR